MYVSYVVGHGRVSSFLYLCIAYILRVSIIISRGYVKCSILCKGNSLRLTIYAYYLREKSLNTGLDASFGKMYDCRGIGGNKAREVNFIRKFM
jgi:hypothetical protein